MVGTPGRSVGGQTGSSGAVNAQPDIPRLQSEAAALAEQVKAKAEDPALQKALGDAYYDLASAQQRAGSAEASASFRQAAAAYQAALKTKQDINVMVDLATAYYYSGDNALAEKAYQDALASNPNFYNARYNYGIFLYQAKKDYEGAISQWQAALAANPPAATADQLRKLISDAHQGLQNPSSTTAANTPSDFGTFQSGPTPSAGKK